ncbi:hypothetical protein C1H46_004586 [Malus baccata]|uniref:Uncharacterized protein n=1 Tax=Malus baccata TaxID=106549 RepID=A0A540NFK9_MALBA|nr:hypothetical protein C1H46_004586 [Malus baccata]
MQLCKRKRGRNERHNLLARFWHSDTKAWKPYFQNKGRSLPKCLSSLGTFNTSMSASSRPDNLMVLRVTARRKNVRSKRKSQQIAKNANNGYITTYGLEVRRNMSLRRDTFNILLIIIKKAPTVFPSAVRIFLTKDNTLSLTPTCTLGIPIACFHRAHLIAVAPLMKRRLT